MRLHNGFLLLELVIALAVVSIAVWGWFALQVQTDQLLRHAQAACESIEQAHRHYRSEYHVIGEQRLVSCDPGGLCFKRAGQFTVPDRLEFCTLKSTVLCGLREKESCTFCRSCA